MLLFTSACSAIWRLQLHKLKSTAVDVGGTANCWTCRPDGQMESSSCWAEHTCLLCSTLQSYIKPSIWQASITNPQNNWSDSSFWSDNPICEIFFLQWGVTSLALSWHSAVFVLRCRDISCQSESGQQAPVKAFLLRGQNIQQQALYIERFYCSKNMFQLVTFTKILQKTI